MQLSTVRELGDKLKAKHPELSSRWEKSCVILLSRRIIEQGQGYWLVGSASKAGTLYKVVLQNSDTKSCECYDFTQEKAPHGWCKHLICVLTMVTAKQREQEQREQEIADQLEEQAKAMLSKDYRPILVAMERVGA